MPRCRKFRLLPPLGNVLDGSEFHRRNRHRKRRTGVFERLGFVQLRQRERLLPDDPSRPQWRNVCPPKHHGESLVSSEYAGISRLQCEQPHYGGIFIRAQHRKSGQWVFKLVLRFKPLGLGWNVIESPPKRGMATHYVCSCLDGPLALRQWPAGLHERRFRQRIRRIERMAVPDSHGKTGRHGLTRRGRSRRRPHV